MAAGHSSSLATDAAGAGTAGSGLGGGGLHLGCRALCLLLHMAGSVLQHSTCLELAGMQRAPDWWAATGGGGAGECTHPTLGPPTVMPWSHPTQPLHAPRRLPATWPLPLQARALRLLCIFAPFLLLGAAMLALAACLPSRGQQGGAASGASSGAGAAGGRRASRAAGRAAVADGKGRGLAAGRAGAAGVAAAVALDGPAVCTKQQQKQQQQLPPALGTQQGPHSNSTALLTQAGSSGAGARPGAVAPARQLQRQLRRAAFRLLLGACRQSGAAFIKWGQWAATREDLFPEVCVGCCLHLVVK